MTNSKQGALFTAAILIATLFLTACNSNYHATFDEAGNWAAETGAEASGDVENGQYIVSIDDSAPAMTYWAVANESFSDGVFSVDAIQLDGALNSGYGMLFRVNNETDDFYLFEISGDGYVWIGICANGCRDGEQTLLGDWWFPSPAVRQGLNNLNQLRVHADGGNMIFYVNNVELGRVSDLNLTQGDVAVAVESLGQGGATVAFDNFAVGQLD